jgi:tetratricopeptide (TPR) repeat protein
MRLTGSMWSHGVSFAILVAAAGVIMWETRHANLAAVVPAAPERSRVTSRNGLLQTIEAMERRLASRPTDSEAAVVLADALLRETRVSGNAGLAVRAEEALTRVLRDNPADYGAQRMLGAVYLSQHRFRDAIAQSDRARRLQPDDDWNYGVIGDGHLELGEYDEAFGAFQRMMNLRPTAGAYARIAYAQELRGRLDAAVEAMRLSTDATPPTDQESIAWHHAQLGDLYRQLGRPKEAAFQYEWADHSFPGHPMAQRGLARVMEMEGDVKGAVTTLEALLARIPAPDLAEELGNLYAAVGRQNDAARAYALAEAGWRDDAPNPTQLARFLADRGRKLEEAVALAEATRATRGDIFTDDALAWSYFKSGRLQEAATAIKRAQRTGSRDGSIIRHAAAIEHALADASRASGTTPLVN